MALYKFYYYLRQEVFWSGQRVCLSVRPCGSLVRSFVCYARCDFSKSKSNLHEISHGCSASVRNFTFNFAEVKVKVQGQNRRTESFPPVIAPPWSKISSTKFGNMTQLILARNMTKFLGGVGHGPGRVQFW